MNNSKQAPASSSSIKDFAIFLGCAVVLALALFIWIKRSAGVLDPRGGLAVGKPMPAINAEGWLNGPPITAEEMKGKTVVINGWFPACINCRREAPELVDLYEKYHPQGVLFVGLTHEGTAALPEIKSFLEKTKIPWPNGYGALQTMIDFDAEFFPVVWVISPEGQVIWNRDSAEPLEEFLASTVK